MNARRLKSTTLAVLSALVGMLALWSAVAAGEVTHTHLFSINEIPANSGASYTGPMFASEKLTLDSGKLFSLGGWGAGAIVNVFNANSGAFASQISANASTGFYPKGMAVNHATGEIYVAAENPPVNPEESPRSVVAVYDAAGTLEGTWGGAETPQGVFPCFECRGEDLAVDNSTSISDWAAGDVIVAEQYAGVVDVFKPTAGGKATYVTQLTGPEPGVPFSSVSAVVVDPSGRLLVLDGQEVDIFEPTVLNEYTFVGRLPAPPAGPLYPAVLAVDGGNGDIYVASNRGAQYTSYSTIFQFSAAGVYLGETTGDTTGPFRGLGALAVDPATHDLYVGTANQAYALVDVLGPPLVVPDVTTTPFSSLKPQSVTLAGTVNPVNAGAATCQFDYGTSVSFGAVAPCPASVPDGGSPVEVQAQVSGLKPNTTYYYRLEATNGNATNFGEPSETRSFKTPGPGIDHESASAVTSVSSTLNASIDPDNVATSYYFQIGTSAAYGTNVPVAPGVNLGSGSGDLPVSVHVQGLTPNTTYHFRVVTVAEVGGEVDTLPGPDLTFTTQPPGSESTSPDGREWEMVTPPNKYGAGILQIGDSDGAVIQAAENGSGMTFGANAPFEANPAGSRALESAQVMSKRKTPGSWESKDITTPHNDGPVPEALGHQAEYKFFTGDLSLGVVDPMGNTPLPPLQAGAEKTLYLRNATGAFEALVTTANVPPGTHFGGNETTAPGAEFVNATPDFSHIELGGGNFNTQLTSTPFSQCGLVLWVAGNLSCTGVSSVGTRHVISNDGSRVIGAAVEGHKGLVLHELTTDEFIQVDAAQGTPEPKSSGTHYITASTDGSRVFFTSYQRLTADSTAVPSSVFVDLYEFELTSAPGAPLAGKLTDLTAAANKLETANVNGVIGASDDGSSVYFVAGGVLGDGAANGATSGHNLYVAKYDTTTNSWGAPHFIASLSGEDWPSWTGNLDDLTARVSPNGRHLAFMSSRNLTGYDNSDANNGAADEEVFLYDAGSARLVCASCNPTGARPVGLQIGVGTVIERLVDWPSQLWEGRWLAANIPGWTDNAGGTDLYQSRYLSDDGRLFFNSSDALVPADTNGTEDVYQYEPAGLGSCQPPGYGQSSSVVFSAAVGGCVGLISAGTSHEESAFMDASVSGGDVFFVTLSQLSPQDVDTSLDIYDAHECTASAPCAPKTPLAPLPCTTGDACKAAPTPQPSLFGAPPSQTFSGAGNVVPSVSKPAGKSKPASRAAKLSKALKACRKKPRHARGACERRAKKRYAARRAHAGNSLSARTRR